LEIFREWITSCARMMPSRICLPSTYPVCSREMRVGRRGFRRLETTFVITQAPKKPKANSDEARICLWLVRSAKTKVIVFQIKVY